MSEKLKPCPFCGASGKANIDCLYYIFDPKENRRAQFYCLACGAEGPIVTVEDNYSGSEVPTEAIDAWNRRAPLYEPVKPEDIANGWYWMVDPDGRESVCGVLGLTVFCERPQPLRGLIAEGYTFYRIPNLEVAE